ncbi:hypothetical protein [Streptacidiphilus jiangxiensis]|uniref:Uncharacterized protein n=1 Tax=Streptacidiphilus jiangxiensis TaxID=235985 RepID=A0A1H7SQ30_STRJI|nr:hypothetical protein [Streptacidiphilus jiangxiensis]SEL74633.1 hypothetical protein SAMN05414137_112149 [Streptacidiphilus jiangxiensis]
MRYALIAVVLAATCALAWITSPTTLAALAVVAPIVLITVVAVLAARPLGDEDAAPGNRRVA